MIGFLQSKGARFGCDLVASEKSSSIFWLRVIGLYIWLRPGSLGNLEFVGYTDNGVWYYIREVW